MADEKRRLIYELLVEAKGLAGGTKQAKAELTDMTRIVGVAKGALGTMFAGFTAAAAVKGLIDVNDEITRITQQLKVFGIEGAAATQAIHDMQDTAVATGASLQSVTNAYKDLSDVAEILGLSQQQVADLVDASTRAMLAQGGTAEQAAQQISTLTFALEKGTITQRELRGVLKENEVLQQAFEQALGKTTKEILKQADAGQIGAREMKKVLDVYTELGKQQTVAPTLAAVTASLWEQAKAFTAAATESSGLSRVLKDLGESVMPESAESARSWGDKLGLVFKALLPPAMQVRLTLEAIAEAQQKANLDANAAANAATAARWKPEEITPAMRRLEGPIPTTKEENPLIDEDRAALAEQQRHDREIRAWRVRSDLANTHLKLLGDMKAQHMQINEIKLKEVDLAQYTIDHQEVLAGIEEHRKKNLSDILKMIETAKPPKLIEESLLDAADAAQVLAHSLMGIFSGSVHNARDFFRTILQGLAEVAAQKAILEAIGNTGNTTGTDASGILGFLGALFKSAKGNVFDRGRVVPMAAGDIVTGPTFFPLSGGRTGLMGEAGAEAVMPLRRGRDGRLGVGASAPSVVINNQTGVAIAQPRVLGSAERLEITLRSAQMGAELAVAEVNRSIRQGYGVTANSLARSYGLRRRV
jgi:tape measure domain-containing protein